MAREMNVEKRSDALKAIVVKTATAGEKAARIADDLSARFQGVRTPEAKQALVIAKAAKKLAGALNKVGQMEMP